ncbi:MAG: UDP-N-acetylglucosamine 2-epimerase [Deltaproteobacteria bacterium]|nr:UDP-N-acetylglucosamine 2-epimerase [Deltaproteobacteria bacterium]
MPLKVVVILGTRPEVIKMAPIVLRLKEDRKYFETQVCATAQHREMLDQVLHFFGIRPDIDLNLMKPDQTLASLTEDVMRELTNVMVKIKPDLVLVQGDTTTTFVGALTSFYRIESDPPFFDRLQKWFHNYVDPSGFLKHSGRLVVITGHRRENFGEGFKSICAAIRTLSREFARDYFVYPVHLNPNVKGPVYQYLREIPNVRLIEPVDYPQMLYLMQKSCLILTDSGGIQEEAPTLKIPVLIMREKTERPEGIEWGCTHLVGTSEEVIVKKAAAFLTSQEIFRRNSSGNPYGDGKAADRVAQAILFWAGITHQRPAEFL